MSVYTVLRTTVSGGLVLALSACGGGFSGIGSGDSGLFGRRSAPVAQTEVQQSQDAAAITRFEGDQKRNTIWDLFSNADDPNTTVEVNKYIWNATLEILNFLPVQSVDPFTGVIVTGFGVPPGGGRAYRATAYIQDPALDARSLKLSLQTRGGGSVSRETARAVEDAILTRARQLRIRDSGL